MAGKKPDYRVMISREGKATDGTDKNFYTEVGAGWRVSNDGISIQLHALPTDGKLVLFPREEKDPREVAS